MANNYVILDSDEEDDALSTSQSPEKPDTPNVLVTRSDTLSLTVQKSNSSTDPRVFQLLYDTNIAPVVASHHEPPSSNPLPSLEQLTSRRQPRMSSSPPSKLKRRRTSYAETFKSTSGSVEVVGKKSRSKSTTNTTSMPALDFEDRNLGKDIWDVPSSASDRPSVAHLKSKHVQKEDALPAMARKESHASIFTAACHATDCHVDQTIANGNVMYTDSSKDASNTSLALPDLVPKDFGHAEDNTIMHAHIWKSSSLQAPNRTANLMSSDETSSKLQVPQSNETWQIMSQSVPSIVQDSDLSRIKNSRGSSASTGNLGSKISVVIPDTLSDSQKKQYDIVKAGSGSSQQATLETIQFTAPSSIMAQFAKKADAPVLEQSGCEGSSPRLDRPTQNDGDGVPAPAGQRTRSLSVSTQHISSTRSCADPASAKRLRRNRSTGHSPSASQISVDELAAPETLIVTTPHIAVSTEGSKKRKRSRRAHQDDVQIDELIGIEEEAAASEQYVPRKSRRSVTEQSLKTNEPSEFRREAQKTLKLRPAKPEVEMLPEIVIVPQVDCVEEENVARDHVAAVLETGLDSIRAASEVEEGAPAGSSTEAAEGAQSIPKPKRGRPRKKTSDVPIKNLPVQAACCATLQQSDGAADTTLQSGKALPAVSKQPGSAVDTTSFASTTLEIATTTQKTSIASSKRAPAKKRGRPRTKTMPVFASEPLYESEDDGAPPGPPAAAETELMPMPETDALEFAAQPMQKQASQASKDITEKSDIVPTKSSPVANVEQIATEASPEKENMIEKRTDVELQTPNKGAAKGVTKHSPLSNSKIAYRVGLSKKRRIAPLLKIRPKAA